MDFNRDVEFFLSKGEDKQELFGIVYGVNGQANKDSQGDYIDSLDELTAAADSFLANGGIIKLNHQEKLSPDRAQVLQSFVSTSDMMIDGRVVPARHFIIKIKIHDRELWDEIRNKRIYKALSLAGKGTRSEDGRMRALSLKEVSIVPAGAYQLANNYLALKEEKPNMSESDKALMAQLAELQQLVVQHFEESPALMAQIAEGVAARAVEIYEKEMRKIALGDHVLDEPQKKPSQAEKDEVLRRLYPQLYQRQVEAQSRVDNRDANIADCAEATNSAWRRQRGG